MKRYHINRCKGYHFLFVTEGIRFLMFLFEQLVSIDPHNFSINPSNGERGINILNKKDDRWMRNSKPLFIPFSSVLAMNWLPWNRFDFLLFLFLFLILAPIHDFRFLLMKYFSWRLVIAFGFGFYSFRRIVCRYWRIIARCSPRWKQLKLNNLTRNKLTQ